MLGQAPLSACNDNLNQPAPLIQVERLSPALGIDARATSRFQPPGQRFQPIPPASELRSVLRF